MSLVGLRPVDLRYVRLYTDEQHAILSFRPGITGAASLAFRHEEQLLAGPDWEQVHIQVIIPQKLALDLNYLGRRTLWSDVKLILRTLVATVRWPASP